jgi:hypothetical protein
MGRYPSLLRHELDILMDIGYDAADSADRLELMDPSEGFPLDDVPLNEHLGVEPGDLTRGRVAIHIDTPGMNFPRDGGWQFYIDSPMDQTVGEFIEGVKAQARELIEAETAYHSGFTIPPDLTIEVTMKWSMRLY